MSGEQSRTDDLAQLARDLHEPRQILANVESVALAGVAQSLADTTDKLMEITKELRDQQLHPWVDTNGVVERFPISKTALLQSGCPRHYVTSHPSWNLHEVHEYFMSV